MPQSAWSDKRERQYEHIKSSQREQGAGEDRAGEVAARTVNKNRAQSGESKRASKTSTRDKSPSSAVGSGRAAAVRRARPAISCTTRPSSATSRAVRA